MATDVLTARSFWGYAWVDTDLGTGDPSAGIILDGSAGVYKIGYESMNI